MYACAYSLRLYSCMYTWVYIGMYIFRHCVYKQACMSIHILFSLYCILCTYRKTKNKQTNKKTEKKMENKNSHNLFQSFFSHNSTDLAVRV